MFRAAEEVRPQLDQSIDTEQGGLGLTDDAIALVGASQGGAMALHLGLRRQRPVRQIVTFAGFLLSDPQETAILSFPPVTMIHGDRDTVVPIEVMQRSATALERMGVPVTTIVATGAGHVLPPENIAVGINAVLEAFGTD
jgi:phospholipase/carboxylesterase